MTNKVLLDSSVLIESFKGSKVAFYEALILDVTKDIFINDIVLSEYLYYILGFSSGVSPRTLQLEIIDYEILPRRYIFFSYNILIVVVSAFRAIALRAAIAFLLQ